MEIKYQQWQHKLYMKVLKLAAAILPISKPTLFIGKESLKQLCYSVSLMGIERVLVVTDQGIEKLGYVKKLTFEFERVGVSCVVFNHVLPDPTYDQVEAGLHQYRLEKCQGVVAIGGGSSIDCAKVIAACATNRKSIKRLVGLLKVWKTPAPLFVIPTTAGTGSEVTVIAVVSDPQTQQKTPITDPKLVPLIAALDPMLMMALPTHITAQTGLDALTHAVEAFISRNATPETDRYAIAAVKLIHDNLEKAAFFGQNLTARQNMALASYYAGLAFTKASLGYTHAIAHAVGAKYHFPHGLANAVVLPHVLEYSKEAAKDKLAKLADVLKITDPHLTDSMKADAFIGYVKELNHTLHIPTQLQGLMPEHIPELAKQAFREAFWNYPAPKYMQQTDCEAIFRKL
ncbi:MULTISPECIES: iron-containing alcohol dehydrogenase [Vibrio]|uniref:Iron-containing alcohol dehydrogenase n=1 Tax=Vibrio anguillarum TaxID=55601 RepID=A0A1Q1ICV1_VIBAN|nr:MULTISPECIES: iron-containing alcohol dehydrogenase [Vibrio]AEH33142.1 hypothetical protein VAA_01457 [Vibrio anguillarum 775]AGU57646.1 alcohol dehydrogenase [Vibrio anguillarum M3]ARV26385.1 iron-containing alcohol dehydrogenase family protein [Vibrio anguillarum]ASF91904.1 alcohol dehydrogenase [Vibrio anguillarum]ASW81080.1 alcohol dehydrogenase [Vibrio anguillarum]